MELAFDAVLALIEAGADYRLESRSGDTLGAIVDRIAGTWDTASPRYPDHQRVRSLIGR